jgi:hypothetical protein
MSQPAACFCSPRIARELTKVFGNGVSAVKVTMRNNKDVPRFIRRIAAAHKKTARSRLQFD